MINVRTLCLICFFICLHTKISYNYQRDIKKKQFNKDKDLMSKVVAIDYMEESVYKLMQTLF